MVRMTSFLVVAVVVEEGCDFLAMLVVAAVCPALGPLSPLQHFQWLLNPKEEEEADCEPFLSRLFAGSRNHNPVVIKQESRA